MRWTSELGHRALGACLALGVIVLSGCPETDPPVANNGGENNMTSNNGASNNGSSCNHLCLADETECLNSTIVLSCTEDSDGCRDFGNPTKCPSGQICQMGECVESSPANNSGECVSTCENGDPPRCNADGQVETCADHDNDGCLNYGDAMDCAEGEICQMGMCNTPMCDGPGCEIGETRCDGDVLQTCQEKAGCPVFAGGKPCGEGEVCMDGACVEAVSCQDECIAGEKLCGPDGIPRACEDADGDGCVEYVDKAGCSDTEDCRGGECVAAETCEDLCSNTEDICDGSAIMECTDGDGDGCKELNFVEDCATAGQICDDATGAARCESPMMTGQVVINEVFYDAAGQDVDANGESPTFIELAGPPGMDISNWEIKLINGSSGMEYNAVTLPQGATIDGYGFAVIATTTPDNFFTALSFTGSNVYPLLAPYASGQDGMQNSDDNVELYDDSGTKIDAMGYGTFSSATFTGEGNPAPDVRAGHSVGRPLGAPDTNDNAADFVSLFPTPGLENGDLLINEIYVDQPGTDGIPDQMETFVELVAPIQGWIDMEMTGYRLRAINGLDGMDYIFTGNDPGVDLSGYAINDLMGSEGFVVICNLGVELTFLIDFCSVVYDGPDYQDGPDSLVLEYQGRVIDAIAYGSFGAGMTSQGEGAPAPLTSADAGKSLNRWPLFDPSKEVDTNDNATDFHLEAPSPGDSNIRPAP